MTASVPPSQARNTRAFPSATWERGKVTITAVLISFLTANLFATAPKELGAAKERFQRLLLPNETDREHYIVELTALRCTFAETRRTRDWQAVDAEIRRHPAPPDSDGFSNVLTGRWASPRHEYVFRRDGSWSMLPETIDGLRSTHGSWRIVGNKYLNTAEVEPPQTSKYTIILLTSRFFIFTDGEVVFYETRITK